MANELEINSLFGAQDTSSIVDTLDFGNNKKYHIHDKQLWDVSYNIAYKVNEVIDEVANIDTTGVNLSEYVDNATAELTYAQNPNTDEVAVLSSVKLNLGGSKDKYLEVLTSYKCPTSNAFNKLKNHFADIAYENNNDQNGIYTLTGIDLDFDNTYTSGTFAYVASYDFVDGINTTVDNINTVVNNLIDSDITSPDLSDGGGVYALSAINFSNLNGDDSNSTYITYEFAYLALYDNVANLQCYLNEHEFVMKSDLNSAGYITIEDVGNAGYIKADDISSYGYITSDDLSNYNYITIEDVGNAGYIKADDIANYGYITSDDLSNYNYITIEDVGNAGYITIEAVGNAGYIKADDIANYGYITSDDLSNYNYITIEDVGNAGYVTHDEIPDLSAIENIADLQSYINGFFDSTYIGSDEEATVNGAYVIKDITFTYTEGDEHPYGASGNYAYVATYDFVDSVKDNADYAYSYVSIWANISAQGSYTGVTNDNDPNTTAVVSGVSLDLTYNTSLADRITLRSTNVASTYAFNSLAYRIDDIEEHTYAFVDNTSNNFTTTPIKDYTFEYNAQNETLSISYTLVNPYTGVSDLPVTVIYGYGETVNDSTAPNNIEAE